MSDPRDAEFETVDQSEAEAMATTLRHGGDLARVVGSDVTVQASEGIFGKAITAHRVQVERDEKKIMLKLQTLAQMNGSSYRYRFPVKKRGGGQDWIEGPTIKLANDLARVFGNNQVDVRAFDQGDSWMFYARFVDLETGFAMTRAFQQRKGQDTIKTKDVGRALDIVFQIGQSKAIRNIVVNALQTLADYTFDEAGNSIVAAIEKNLPASRQRIEQRIAELKIDLKRVEAMVGRPLAKWLAPDIARVVAETQSVIDGMADPEDIWPSDVERPSRQDGKGEPTTAKAGTAPAPEQRTERQENGADTDQQAKPQAQQQQPAAAEQAQPQTPAPAKPQPPQETASAPAAPKAPAAEKAAPAGPAWPPMMPAQPKGMAAATAAQWWKWTLWHAERIRTMKREDIAPYLSAEENKQSFDNLSAEWPQAWAVIDGIIDFISSPGKA